MIRWLAVAMIGSMLVCWGGVGTAGAVNYYVSPDGSNENDGLSESTPFATPQYAHDKTEPGDTVFFMTGEWRDTITNDTALLAISRSGTADKWIVYTRLAGHSPKFYFRDWACIEGKGVAYIVIDGLEVQGNKDEITYEYAAQRQSHATGDMAGGGIGFGAKRVISGRDTTWIPPHHITIRNCTVYKCCGGGIGVADGDYITVEYNEVYENSFYSPWATSGLSIFHAHDVDNNTGLKIIVRGNRSHHNQNLFPFISAGYITDGNGLVIDDFQNTQKSSRFRYVKYKGKTLVENNIFYKNGGTGCHAYHSDNVTFRNNTLYKNCLTEREPWPMSGEIYTDYGWGCVMVNNIVYAVDGKTINGRNCTAPNDLVEDYNLFYNHTNIDAGEWGSHTINGKDPLFVDPENGDFRLRDGSPAINAGKDDETPQYDIAMTARPVNGRVDMGAYEFAPVGVQRAAAPAALPSRRPSLVAFVSTGSRAVLNNLGPAQAIHVVSINGKIIRRCAVVDGRAVLTDPDMGQRVYLARPVGQRR